MQLNQFDYFLPPELIAQFPKPKRSQSRLLCLQTFSTRCHHHQFSDLVQFLKPHDLLIFNDSRVIPARLYGKKISGGKIEVLVERILQESTALAHIRANKKIKIGHRIVLDKGYLAEIIERRKDLFLLRFLTEKPILQILDEIGHIPLPHYMEREDEALDFERYQTVYSRIQGSVAAPTAGLHFDEGMLEALRQKRVDMAFVTLHVGAGTFQPVRVENIADHVIHSELVDISEDVVNKINQTKKIGGRVIAVGTTSVRCLETASKTGVLVPYQGESNLFIYPGYQFQCVDAMITNFHAPKTSLLMLVSAFAGLESIKMAYQEAIAQQYRFFSYGDAMFIAHRFP